MTSVFTYGSLAVPEVWTLVAGRLHVSEPALLSGFRRRVLRDAPYPGIVPSPSELVDGVLWHGIDTVTMARLDDFEGDLYERLPVEVLVGEEAAVAHAYVVRPRHQALLSPEPWDEATFREHELERYLEGCQRFAESWSRIDD